MSGTDDIKSLTDCGCCETPDLTYPGHFNRRAVWLIPQSCRRRCKLLLNAMADA